MSLLLPISKDSAVPKTPCLSGFGDGRKVFFVVLPDGWGGEYPCKYHEQVPLYLKATMIYGLRLDDPTVAELTCQELYERYLMACEMDCLLPCNIQPNEYWTRLSE